MALTILIIGGYGTFGGRLTRLLADEVELTLIVAGRSAAKARDFCAQVRGAATVLPRIFDREGDVDAQIAHFAPHIVVDASGPWQDYGRDPYRLVRAAIEAGADYLDLADAPAFVLGVDEMDELAKTKGRFALSGVSSFPVLTCLVAKELSKDMAAIGSIEAGIAPSPFAGVGRNVINAIASYAGRPVAIRREGRTVEAFGLIDSRMMTIAVPGRVPLHPLRFSLVDVPDLKILPRLWPELREAWAGAGPVPAVMHRLLTLAAWLVRVRAMRSLVPMAPLINWATENIRWGEHRGGMIVRVRGRNSGGHHIARSWHLLAEGDTGPLIPSMAAEAAIRNCLAGRRPPPGARWAVNDLKLDDYLKLFAARGIITGNRDDDAGGALYRQMLGEAYERLAPPLRALHQVEGNCAL